MAREVEVDEPFIVARVPIGAVRFGSVKEIQTPPEECGTAAAEIKTLLQGATHNLKYVGEIVRLGRRKLKNQSLFRLLPSKGLL
jgi:hypothetical protein